MLWLCCPSRLSTHLSRRKFSIQHSYSTGIYNRQDFHNYTICFPQRWWAKRWRTSLPKLEQNSVFIRPLNLQTSFMAKYDKTVSICKKERLKNCSGFFQLCRSQNPWLRQSICRWNGICSELLEQLRLTRHPKNMLAQIITWTKFKGRNIAQNARLALFSAVIFFSINCP